MDERVEEEKERNNDRKEGRREWGNGVKREGGWEDKT